MKLNKKTIKILLYLLSAIIISTLSITAYIYFPKKLETFDSILRDYMFSIRGPLPDSKNVVIVDLDDRALQSVGQWPWSRDVVANLIQNLTNAGVGVIGLDIVFAENDRSSPHALVEKLNLKLEKNTILPNYDEELAYTIANSPVILGYQFQFGDEEYATKKTPEVPVVFIERGRNYEMEDYVLGAEGTLLNIPIIQDNAYSSGFFNNLPDISGTIRSVPLVIRYDLSLYPSLALESLRAALGIDKILVNYDDAGVNQIILGDFKIPTDRYGRLVVNYRGAEKSFKYISALDILNNTFDKKDIEGKIVLIGTTAAGLQDLRSTPFDSIFPGVEIHANVIDNILTGEYLFKPSWADGANLVHIVFIAFFLIFALGYMKVNQVAFILAGSVALGSYLLYYLMFDMGIILNLFFPLAVTVVSTISVLIINYFFETKQSALIKAKFANKVSAKVMEDLLQNENDALQAVSKEITVFFSDVRNFTNISEAMPSAQVLIDYLNQYMNPMTDIIIKKEGTIDKYIGDAIMAYWNAPVDIKNHQDKALQAAIEQIEYLDILNKKLTEENFPLIDIGIGLNCGTAVVGEMGSLIRSDYTVIGDPVNLGARLESLCKGYGSKILISQYIKDALTEEYIIRDLDMVRVKGKTEPIAIYEVHINKLKNVIEEELELFHEALYTYRDANFQKALDLFKALIKKEDLVNKKAVELYILRCEEYIATPPENFDGVYTYTTK
jgi:adenylate cyclase